jgi:trans-2,3-dihydro-3-hydroxyanthranilate isomerase
MQLPFHTLDVFTADRFAGNPLAVVLEADGLDTPRMAAIAREFNAPETVFVMKPQNPSHTARVRIFTPAAELPFAGHPTVGTSVLLAELRAPAQGISQSIVVLEETIGPVRVGVRFGAREAPFGEFDAPRLPEEQDRLPGAERLAAALDLIPSEIGFENHRPMRFTAGNSFAFVPIASLDAIAKAQPNMAHWGPAFGSGGAGVGAFLYTRQCVHTTSAFHARMFAPHHGVAEDPATGSAAVGLAGSIARFDELPDGTHKRSIEQGYEMGRPSLIQLTLEVMQERLKAVRIGGQAVRVGDGMLRI